MTNKPKCANCPNREQCEADTRIGRELSKVYATFPIRQIDPPTNVQLAKFAKKLGDSQVSLPSESEEILTANLWDLYA